MLEDPAKGAETRPAPTVALVEEKELQEIHRQETRALPSFARVAISSDIADRFNHVNFPQPCSVSPSISGGARSGSEAAIRAASRPPTVFDDQGPDLFTESDHGLAGFSIGVVASVDPEQNVSG